MSIQPISFTQQANSSANALLSGRFRPAGQPQAQSDRFLDAALRFNAQADSGGRLLPETSLPLNRTMGLLQRTTNAAAFGRQAAQNTRAQGYSIREGVRSFPAQRNTAAYLNVLAEIISRLPTAAVGDPAANRVLDALPDLGRAGQHLGQVGQDLLLEQLGAEARLQVIDSFRIDPNDQASLAVVDSIIGAVTGRPPGHAAQSTGSISALPPQTDAVLGAMGAAYSAYELVQNWGETSLAGGVTNGAAFGSYVGSLIVPGVGTAVGGAIGAVGGALLSLFRSGKHPEQQARDQLRSFMQENGFINQDYQVRLADGSYYDIGKDGGHRLKNLDGTSRGAYDVDFSNPLSHEAIGWIQPLAAIITGGNEKLKNDLTGYLVNAALSNADTALEAAANAGALYQAAGLDAQQALASIGRLAEQGAVSADQAMAYAGGIAFLSSATDSQGTRLVQPQAA